MNVLILTGKFGMGHVKAAEAIREDLTDTSNDVKVHIVDFMEYIFPDLCDVIYKGFHFVVSRCSGVYNYLNKIAGKYGDAPLKGALTKKIDNLIEAYDADMLIAALPICGQYISAYKRSVGCTLPLYTYVTDITAHEEWISDGTDLYFVGDLSTRNALISKGVHPEKVLVTGIPVRKAFHRAGMIKENRSRAADMAGTQSGKVLKRHEKKHVLIMGGGLGLLPGGNEILRLANESPDFTTTLITGKNVKLEKEAREKYPNIRVVGFTNSVDLYMKEADLIITKPGGITTFEAIASRTPLYVIDPFLEQEKGNARYIENHNIGRVLWGRNTSVKEDFLQFISDDRLLKTMKENMKNLEKNFSPVNPLEYYMEREIEKCC